ncbi:MAG: hypothetical protein QME78_10085 [Thermodesulfobacteriota bacterium]|nr:hypothetical protein [Thermodesulfobacteriota bacterium]
MKETSGYKGWWPMKVFTGTGSDGEPQGQECFKSVVDGKLVIPEKGWDDSPPYPTGDLASVRYPSDKYREGWERIFGNGAEK